MKKNLVILLNSYPFFKGEPYFETEIKYLAKNFDHIIIFSIVASKKEKMTRVPPCGIKIIPLGCPKNHFLNLLRGFFVSANDFRTKHLSFKKKMIMNYAIGRNYSIYKKAINYFKKNNINYDNTIIYSYWLSFGMSAIKIKDFLTKKQYKNIKMVSRAHGYDLFWERMPLNFAPLQQKIIEQSDGVFSVSETGRLYLINKYNFLKGKIFLSRLGTEDYGVSDASDSWPYISFATCSNNRPVKRLDLFATSFSNLIKEKTGAKWNAIGLSGCETEITSQFQQNEIERNINFYGFLKNKQIYEIYKTKKISYLVNVSSSEGLPVSIMEALSFGIPVIATDVGGTKELVDNSCGFLIDKNITSKELKKILLKASSISKKEYKDMCINARKKWESVADAEKNYLKWCDTLKEI